MSGADQALPWPECLGIFDEESCRYFLRELGQRVVQFYPFSVGMEEVYVQIVDKYGFKDAADVMSVLQELLEDDSTAAGVGDDGDIWRSWRHSWRHRNDNAQNPHIPRVRGRLLGLPTSMRIRLLKSANFAALQSKQARSHPVANANDAKFPTTGPTHEAAEGKYPESNTEIPVDANSVDLDYHSILAERDFAQAETNRYLNTISLQITDESIEDHHRQTSSRLSPRLARKWGSPKRSMPASSRDKFFPSNLVSPNTRKPEQASDSPLSRYEPDISLCTVSLADESENLAIGTASIVHTTPLSSKNNDGNDGRFSLASDFGLTSVETNPGHRRAIHRQARMIDGSLFQGKSRKDKFVEGQKVGLHSPVKTNVEPISKRSSAPISSSSRESWVQVVFSRFQGERARKSKHPKLREQKSTLIGCTFEDLNVTKANEVIRHLTTHHSQVRQSAAFSEMGCDGTYERPIHSEKPLPLSPGDYCARPSMQSDTERAFFGCHPDPALLHSPASFTYSLLGDSKDNKESQCPASAGMTKPGGRAPKEKMLRDRFSSSSSECAPPSSPLFVSDPHLNGCSDFTQGEPPSPLLKPPVPLMYRNEMISSTVWPFRASPDSMAGNKVAATSHSRSRSPDSQHRPVEVERDPWEERGRSPMTPISPSRLRFESRQRSPRTPRQRSPSPVKKLIGMVKSMSAHQMPSEPPPSKTDTPPVSSRRRWKELTHKFRYGFLTPGLEQLDQEEMMEQYAADQIDSIRIVAPPPSKDRPLFPVSIRSSGQSKLWSELEYMLIETCNTFLKDELGCGRLSRDSVLRTKRQWQAKNRPQVIEFYYDQTTQYKLIIANLRTVQLYSDYSKDAIVLNAVLQQWKVLIRELNVKTLCMPDSVVRRWLHDGRRILELLGAPQVTLQHLDKLTALCQAVIGSAEKERAKNRQQLVAEDIRGPRHRSASDGSQYNLWKHEQALLRSNDTPPPVPTPTTFGSRNRKMTPQEKPAHQFSVCQGRLARDYKRSVVTHGNGHNSCSHSHSKSAGYAQDVGRFVVD